MDGHNVLIHLFNLIKTDNNVAFALFTTSVITFSSVLTFIMCIKDNTTNGVRLLGMEHDLGSISSELNKLENNLTLRLDMQNAEQDDVRNIIVDIKNKQETIQNFIMESD